MVALNVLILYIVLSATISISFGFHKDWIACAYFFGVTILNICVLLWTLKGKV